MAINPWRTTTEALLEQSVITGEFPHLEAEEFFDVDPEAPGLRKPPTEDTYQAILESFKDYLTIGTVTSFGSAQDVYTEERAKEMGHDVIDRYIGKSYSQIAAEFEVGKAARDILVEKFPDNRDYNRSISLDVNTGELIYPRFRAEELIPVLKEHPSFSDPYHQNWDNSQWKRYIEGNYQDLLLNPDDVDFYDVLDNTLIKFYNNWATETASFAAQGWQTFVHAVDYIGAIPHYATGMGGTYDWKTYVDYGSIEEMQESGNWTGLVVTGGGKLAEMIEEPKAEKLAYKTMFDASYQDYGNWVENTPLWGNMDDGLAWSRVVLGALPSLAMTYGTAGLSYKGARLAGLGRDAARKVSLKTSFATTGFVLEGPSALQGAIAYHSSPRQMSEEEFMSEQTKWKDEYLEDYYIIDEGTGKTSFPDVQSLLDSETKTKKTRREFDNDYKVWFNDNYYSTGYGYWKKGMSVADAMDQGIWAALLYAPIAAKLETMSANRFFEVLPGGWGTAALSGKAQGAFTKRLDWAMRKIPGSNKLMQIPSSFIGKFSQMAVVEGMEEVSQYTAETLLASGLPLTSYKKEFDWDWHEVFESFAGGAVMGGGLTTGAALVNKTGITDRLANRSRMKEPLEEGIEVMVKRQGENDKTPGAYGLYYTIDGGEMIQLKEGDGILESDIADNYTSFGAANKQAKILRNRARRYQQEALIKNRGEFIDATVSKPVFNEEEGVYEFEVTGRDGKLIEVVKAETLLSAKNKKRNQEQHIKHINKVTKDLDLTEDDVQVLQKEGAEESVVADSEGSESVQNKEDVVFLKNYLSEPVNESEVPIEEELIKKGRIPTVSDKMSAKEKKAYEEDVLKAIGNEQAIIDSGLSPGDIIKDIQDDFGTDAANKAAKILKQGPPTPPSDIEGPEIEDSPVVEEGPPSAPSPKVDADKKKTDKKEDKEGPPPSDKKKVGDMSLKELNDELSKKKKKKDPMSKIRVKRIKKELEERKKKVGKATISAIKKKQMEKKINKFRDKSVKELIERLLEGKTGEALIKDIGIDEKVLEEIIDWVDSQRAIMGDQWTDSSMMQLMSLSFAYEQMKAEEAKTDKKKEKEPKVEAKDKEKFKEKATFRLADIFIAQEDFSEALAVLEILEEDGKDIKKINAKRELIKKKIKEGEVEDIELTADDFIGPDSKNVEDWLFEDDEGPIREQKVTYKPQTIAEARKEAVKRNVKNIVKRLRKIVVLEGGKQIKVKFIERDDAPPGQWDGEQIVINLKKADETTAIHEFMHPFIEGLFVHNKEKFNEIYEELKETKTGQEVIQWVSSEYGENHYLFKVEVIVESIARTARMKNPTPRNPFVNAVMRFLQFLKSLFFKNATHVDTYNIPPNITVKGLADMLDNYMAPPLFNVLNVSETNEYIGELASLQGNAGFNAEVVDGTRQSILSPEEIIMDDFTDFVEEMINDSLDKNNNLHKGKLKKNFKNAEDTIIKKLLEKYKFIDVTTLKSDTEFLNKKDKERAIDFLARMNNRAQGILTPTDISEFLPSFSEEHISSLAVISKSLFTIMDFKYKFATFLGDNSRATFNIKDIAKEKFMNKAGLKKNEKGAVSAFQNYLKEKLPNLNALTGEAMKSEYLNFVREYYGMNFLQVRGYENDLHYKDVYNDAKDSSKRETARILLANNKLYRKGHQFDIGDTWTEKQFFDEVESKYKEGVVKDVSAFKGFNGLGWFAFDLKGLDVILYEYQTDVIDDIIKNLKNGSFSASYEEASKFFKENSSHARIDMALQKTREQFLNGNPRQALELIGFIMPEISIFLSENYLISKTKNLPSNFYAVEKMMDEGKSAKEILTSKKHIMDKDFVRNALTAALIFDKGTDTSSNVGKILAKNKFKYSGANPLRDVFARLKNNPSIVSKLEKELIKDLDIRLSGREDMLIHSLTPMNVSLNSYRRDLKKVQAGKVTEDELMDYPETHFPHEDAAHFTSLENYSRFLENKIVEQESKIDEIKNLIKTLKDDPLTLVEIGVSSYLAGFLNNYIMSYEVLNNLESGANHFQDIWNEYKEKGQVWDIKDDKGEIVQENVLHSKSMLDGIYGTPGLVPEITSLWDNWFDILLKTSLSVANNKVSDDGSIYLNTAGFLSAVEGNPLAREIYTSKAEAYIDNFSKMIIDSPFVEGAGKDWFEILKEIHPKLPNFQLNKTAYDPENLITLAPELINLKGSNPARLLSVMTGHQNFHTIDEVYKALIPYKEVVDTWIKKKTIEYKERIENEPTNKKWIKNPVSNPRGGPWFQALEKLIREKVIKVTIEKPSYSKWELYKIEILNHKALTPNRFQKSLQQKSDMRFKPKNEAEAYDKVKNVVRYQLDKKPSRTARVEANNIFKGAWADINNILKDEGKGKADIWDFRRGMINNLPGGMMNDYFFDWFDSKFKNHPSMKKRKDANKSNNGTMANPEDVDDAALSLFNDSGFREGINRVVEQGNSDERDIGINEFQWMTELGLMLKKENLDTIKDRAKKNYRKGRDFEDFAKQLTPYIGRRFSSLNDYQKMQTLRFYVRINSYISTNHPEGKYNERDNYIVTVSNYSKTGKYTDVPIVDFQLKDGENIKTGNQNPYGEKIMLFESTVEKDLFKWIGKKDYYKIKRKLNKFTQRIDETVGDIYGFLDGYEFSELINELEKNDLAVAFMRGEQRKLGLVKITDTHKKDFRNLEAYIENEKLSGYIPDDYDIVVPEEMSSPKDIAIHEAMKKVWPRYLFDRKGGANIMKRIKIPFTPISTTKDLPDYNIKIFNPAEQLEPGGRKVSFVFDDGKTVVPAMTYVKGVGWKYINDGGSMAGAGLWSNMVRYAGVPKDSGSNKNVIYNVEGMSTLMVKHEMSKVEKNMEIWYNKGQADEQLIAKSNGFGLIVDAEGNNIDLLATPDEVKVGTKGDGYAIDAVHTVPGASMGFINYRDKVPNTATHGTQWYGYVENDEILQAFADNIMKSMNTQLAGLWNMSVDSRDANGQVLPGMAATDKIAEFLINKLENDNEGYRHSVVEHAKLGAGLHRGMEPMLNQLLQTKGMLKILKAGLQQGTRSKIVGNLRGDLGENEIALAKQNATPVYKAYAEAHDMSLTDARKVILFDINKWLETNPVELMVTRYPVPHVGAVLIAKVKRLHSRKGLIEMNPIDVYAKLEGDMDGDEVQVESLNPEHTKLVKDYLSKLNITGINLNEYVPKDRDKINFLSEEDRIELMSAISHGGDSIGEIANLLNVYGQLSRMFDHAIIDNNRIQMRKLDDKAWHPGLKKEMPLREIFRLYMQAALDNAEFMLLDTWKYHLPSLYTLMFKKADGTAFKMVTRFEGGVEKEVYEGTLIYNALKPLINKLKIPGRLRKGGDFQDGRYTLEDVILKSDDFRAFVEHPQIGFKKEAAKDEYLTMGPVGMINDLVFKENKVTAQIKIIKGWKNIPAAEVSGEGINVIRKFDTDNHFGNPWTSRDTANAIKVDTFEEAVENYEQWLLGNIDMPALESRRKWILSQIDSGALDNATLLYFENTPDNHATRLLKVIKQRRGHIVPSPWQMTAIAASKTMEENIIKYDRKGFDNTLFQTNKLIHENAHLESVKWLDTSKKQDLIERAYQQDLKNGLVKGSKSSYLNSQKTAGLVYRNMMGKSWIKSLINVDTIGPQTLDRNDKIRFMAEKYDTDFKNLSKTARVIATLGFLEGFKTTSDTLSENKFTKSKALKVFSVLPHASTNKNELQLLDEHVLMMYYKHYNSIVSNLDNRTFKQMSKKEKVRHTYKTFDGVITRMCR